MTRLVAVIERADLLRHTWRHRFAHDPLCERHIGGSVQLGSARVCRSCLAMYGGAAVGVASLAVAPHRAWPRLWLVATGLTSGISQPDHYAGLSRRQKDAVRGTTGFLAASLLRFGLARRWGWFAGSTALVVIAYRRLTAARAARKATACDGCPELAEPGVCSGFATQAVELRRYEESASARATRRRMAAHAS